MRGTAHTKAQPIRSLARPANRRQAEGLERVSATGWRGVKQFDTLSGGQQARLQALMLERAGANLLLLDEPTNNLNLDSAEALERALDEFAGTVIGVTHDRWLMRSFDRFLYFDRQGNAREAPDFETILPIPSGPVEPTGCGRRLKPLSVRAATTPAGPRA